MVDQQLSVWWVLLLTLVSPLFAIAGVGVGAYLNHKYALKGIQEQQKHDERMRQVEAAERRFDAFRAIAIELEVNLEAVVWLRHMISERSSLADVPHDKILHFEDTAFRREGAIMTTLPKMIKNDIVSSYSQIQALETVLVSTGFRFSTNDPDTGIRVMKNLVEHLEGTLAEFNEFIERFDPRLR